MTYCKVPPPPTSSILLQRLEIIVGLLVLLFIGFCIPMLHHFWSGMDEPVLLGIQEFWYQPYDIIGGRPLGGVGAYLGNCLTSQTLDGIIFVYLLLRFLTALSVYGLVVLLTGRKAMAFPTALLFIVNPMELMRFFPAFLIVYVSAVAFLSIAIFLLVYSYKKDIPLLLIPACLFLGASLLNYESGYPISLLGIVFLFYIGRRKNLYIWICAWLGTISICAAKFLYFISTTKSAYQISMYKQFFDAKGNLFDVVVFNFKELVFAPFLNMFPSFDAMVGFLPYTIPGILVCALVLWRIIRVDKSLVDNSKKEIISMLASFGMIVLCVSPWLLFGRTTVHDFYENPSLRYLFYASIPQSLLIIFCCSLVTSLVWRRCGRILYFTLCLLVLFLGMTQNYAFQEQHGVVNPYVDYLRVSRIFQQIEAMKPTFEKDTVLFFDIDPEENSPIGWGYNVMHMSCLMFGHPGYQGHIKPNGAFSIRGLTGYANEKYHPDFRIGNPLVFKVNGRGDVILSSSPLFYPDNCKLLPYQNCIVNQISVKPDGKLPFLAPNSPHIVNLLHDLSVLPLRRWN